MADVAAALALPALLVVALKLGCLNHTFLTVRALSARGVPLAGWVGNSIDPAFERAADNIGELEKRLQPAVAIVPYASHAPEALELPSAAARDLVARALLR